MQVALYRPRLYLGMYVCICMWQQLMEKRGHEFERERDEYKEVYGERKKEEKMKYL